MAKKVLVTGTFDILHKGHEAFLKESKKYGDYLIVVVATDKTLDDLGKEHKNNEKTRLESVRKLHYVDEAVLGYESEDKHRIVIEKKPDVICLGYDQTSFTEDLKKRLEKRGLKVKVVKIRAFRPHIYKSSRMR